MLDEAKTELGSYGTLLILVVGYLIWCTVAQQKTGSWTWQPWEAISSHRLALKSAASEQPPVQMASRSGYKVLRPASNPEEESIAVIGV